MARARPPRCLIAAGGYAYWNTAENSYAIGKLASTSPLSSYPASAAPLAAPSLWADLRHYGDQNTVSDLFVSPKRNLPDISSGGIFA